MANQTAQPFLRKPRKRHQPGRAGFSLIELLISMGILVVGLVMAGTLFPAAIKQTSRSVDDTIGTIICQNALAVAKAKLTYNDGGPADITTLAPVAPSSFVNVTWPTNTLITEAELAYPAPRTPIASYIEPYAAPPNYPDPLGDWWNDGTNDRPTTDHGAIVLARQVRAGENDYLLVVISYKKKISNGDYPHKNVVIAEALDVTLVNEANKDYTTIDISALPATDQDKFLKGTAIILDEDDIDNGGSNADDFMYGVFAKLKMIEGGVGRLDVRLPEGPLYFDPSQGARTNINVWVVYEADQATNTPLGNSSPTMSIFTTRTALND